MPVVGEALVRVRVFSAGMDNDIRDEIRRQLGSNDIDRDAENTGRRIMRNTRSGMERENRGGLSKLFGNFGSDAAEKFGDAFNLGIGRARMGRGIISLLTAAGPSIISAGAAMGTALAAEILTAMSAIGPGLIGLGLSLGAGLATAALNAGLLYAAFKSGADGLKELGEEAKALAKELGTPIAQGMVQGFRDAVSTLRGALPELNEQLKTTGERFGAIAKGAAETLVSSENMGRLKSIFSTNNEFLDRFKNGLNDLITSFLILLNAAKPFIDYLGQGLEKFGAWAKTMLEAGEASGKLNEGAQRYLDRWKQLWQTIKDFAAGLSNLFKAIAPVGQKLADSMGQVAANFRAWTGDEANQGRITAFFEKAHELSTKIFDVLGKLFSAGGNAFMEADFTNLFAVMDSIATKLGPAIAQIFNQIQEAAGPHLVAVVENLGGAFQKIADNGTIGIIAGLVGTLLEKITELLNTDIGAWVLGAGVAWALFGGIISPIVSLLTTLIGGISGVGVAIAAVVGFFVLMWQNSVNLREKISELVDVVGGKFTEIWDKVGPKISELWDNIVKLAGAVGDRLAPVIAYITPLISSFLSLFGDVLSNGLGAFSNFIGMIADILQGDWSGALEHAKALISSLFDLVKSVFTGIADFIYNLWPGLWDWVGSVLGNIGGFISDIWNDIIDGIQEAGTGFRDWWNNLWEWTGEKISGVWSAISGAFTTITDGIRDFGNWIKELWDGLWIWVGETAASLWEWITGVVTGAWNGLTSAIMSVGTTIQEWWNSLWTWVGETAASIWNGITSTLSAIWQGIVNVIHFLFDPWIDFFSQLWTNIQNIASNVWNAITSTLSTIWNSISTTATSIFNSIANFLSNTWEGIKSTASSVWNSITGVASTAWNAVTGAIRTAVDSVVGWLSGIWEDIKGTADTVWNSIAGIASSAWSAVQTAIVQPIEDAYNTVVGWINDIKNAVTGVIDWIGGKASEVNGKLESILADQAKAGQVGVGVNTSGDTAGVFGGGAAEGGMFPAIPGGWMVNVSEGGRDERIEPLDSQGLSRRDKSLISHIVSQMAVNGGGGGDTQVTIMLDGRQLSGVVAGVVTNQLDGQARDIRRRRRTSA